MILETYPNTRETDKICLDMIYQTDITYYINKTKELKKNLLKSCRFIWELWNFFHQKSIETNIEYEAKIQENTINLIKYNNILIN